MAILFELDEAWEAWMAERPKMIQEMAVRLPPNRLYRLKTTGHRCTLYSYSENGTVTVSVTGEYNAVAFSRNVFGIELGDLEECDLPGEDERLGDLAEDMGIEPEAMVDFIKRLEKRE